MTFIVIEALDGVGKTTLCAALARHLGAIQMDTPGPDLRPLREPILAALGDDQAARALFYAATVRAAGARARAVPRPVVMDRYWLSTRAYASARGAQLPWSALEAHIPPPDVTLLLTLDEPERRRRLLARGCTPADLETLDPTFRARVDACWRSPAIPPPLRPIPLDLTGAGVAEAVRRVVEVIAASSAGGAPKGTHV